MTETITPTAPGTPFDALHILHRATAQSLRELPVDLSHRQLGILLTIYMAPPPHTVRSLSDQLSISKPAVCRALDTLSMHDLVRRKKDENDRRIVYLNRTVNGSVYLRDLGEIFAVAMAQQAS